MKTTNVVTPFQGDDSAEMIDESRQYLSPCSQRLVIPYCGCIMQQNSIDEESYAKENGIF